MVAIANTTLSPVRLTYGAHDLIASIGGLSVAEVRLAYTDILNVSEGVEAYLNGGFVEDWHTRLIGGDRLEFMKSWGRKGAWDNHGRRTAGPGFVEAFKELATIGEQVKLLNLEAEQAVEEVVRRVAQMLEKRLEHYSKEEMLTIQQVARILGCSYGEARNRMLEGRIKSVKDGRWHRTRREWVEEYIEKHAIYTDPSLVQIPVATRRTRKTCGVKPNSIAVQFLLERKK